MHLTGGPVIFLWLFLACAVEEIPCRDGFERDNDGHCYQEEVPTIKNALENLPDCEPVGGDGAIDLINGCASGACPNMTYPTINEILGEEGDCNTSSWDKDYLICEWTIGLDIGYDDKDEDDVPDSNALSDRIHLYPPYMGGTIRGIGVEANPRCFVDELGMPSYIGWVEVGTELLIRDFIYEHWGMWTYDRGRYDSTDRPNGYIDEIYLYGMP
jgi:hypothetical protein